MAMQHTDVLFISFRIVATSHSTPWIQIKNIKIRKWASEFWLITDFILNGLEMLKNARSGDSSTQEIASTWEATWTFTSVHIFELNKWKNPCKRREWSSQGPSKKNENRSSSHRLEWDRVDSYTLQHCWIIETAAERFSPQRFWFWDTPFESLLFLSSFPTGPSSRVSGELALVEDEVTIMKLDISLKMFMNKEAEIEFNWVRF